MARRALDMPLRTVWAQVAEVRERLDQELAELPEDIRAAAIMTASELVENAIKYGEPVDKAPKASVALELDAGSIEIVVRSGARSPAAVSELQRHVNELRSAPDRAVLYMGALQQTMNSSDGRSGLGIFRIGFEGGFDLSCDYADDVVTVRATRAYAAEPT